ncbi:hypothetical protein LCGC14_2510260 [marine sediment metagenome]|uniref:Uncharacterized protein n=1 Tax=marine sediment metagenome TaxID=412755 RepID=A0A0F9AZB7_9ZZZZ
MDDQLSHRVRAAARAGLCTLIIFMVYLTAGWLAVMALLHVRPGWVLAMCGGGKLTWDDLQIIYIRFFGVAKIMLLAVLIAVVWLALWARRLASAK